MNFDLMFWREKALQVLGATTCIRFSSSSFISRTGLTKILKKGEYLCILIGCKMQQQYEAIQKKYVVVFGSGNVAVYGIHRYDLS